MYSAEQLYGAGKGATKLEYVENALEKRGLKADTDAIEATVREMNLLHSWETAIRAEDTDDGGEA